MVALVAGAFNDHLLMSKLSIGPRSGASIRHGARHGSAGQWNASYGLEIGLRIVVVGSSTNFHREPKRSDDFPC